MGSNNNTSSCTLVDASRFLGEVEDSKLLGHGRRAGMTIGDLINQQEKVSERSHPL